MNKSIIFVPICPKCHHVFEHIDVGIDFNIVCPECGNILNSIKFPDFNKICYITPDGKTRFNYNQSDCY